MNVDELVRATLKRKLACILVALCAVGAAVYGYLTSTVTYESTAVAVVYPPGAGNVDAKLNPFVNLDDNMAQLAAVTASTLQSAQAVALVDAAGASPDYTVTTTLGDTASAMRLSPQLVITTTADTPEQAQAGAQALLDYSAVALDRLQKQTGVTTNTEASVTAVIVPGPGSVVPSSPFRAAGAYGLAVMVVGMLAIVCTSTYLDRRRAPRTGRHSGVDSAPPTGVAATRGPEAEPSSSAASPVRAARPNPWTPTPSLHWSNANAPDAGAPAVRNDGPAGSEHVDAPADSEDADAPAGSEHVDAPAGSEHVDAPAGSEYADTAAQVSVDRVHSVRPPKWMYTEAPSRPEYSVSDFDPFDVPYPRDPRAQTLGSDRVLADPLPIQKAALPQLSPPVASPLPSIASPPRAKDDVDDYYGVEERIHVPVRRLERRDAPRSFPPSGPRR